MPHTVSFLLALKQYHHPHKFIYKEVANLVFYWSRYCRLLNQMCKQPDIDRVDDVIG